jgi:hypothetical protein
MGGVARDPCGGPGQPTAGEEHRVRAIRQARAAIDTPIGRGAAVAAGDQPA